jgi:DNA replication protein DnaC
MSAKYEFTQGVRVHQSWTDKPKVPVPPQHIRERLRFPARYAMATLAAEVADTYPPNLYNGARDYLVNWPTFYQRGMGPIFAGRAGSGTSWTAAALANEIVLRSQGVKDITASWLSTSWMLKIILDYRDLKHSEGYNNLRNNMMKHELIVVDDLLAAGHVEGGGPFLHFYLCISL